MHEAVFKNRLGNLSRAIRHAVKRHDLGLHIGGEAGVRLRADRHRLRAAVHRYMDPVRTRFNLSPRLADLVDHNRKRVRSDIGERHITLRRGRGRHEGTRLNAVGDHGVFRAVKRIAAVNHNGRRAVTLNLRAHRAQAVREIHHFRLTRGVFNHRAAFGEDCRHHDVFGSGDRHHIGHDLRPLQPAALQIHESVINLHVGSHLEERLNVLIDRTGADRAAAGERHPGRAEPRGERAEHENRCPHGFHELIRGDGARHIRSAQPDGFPVLMAGDAHAFEQAQHRLHIREMRHVMQHQLVRRQKACGQDGEYCVFGSGDPDRSGEAIAADNPELFHRKKFDQLKNKKRKPPLLLGAFSVNHNPGRTSAGIKRDPVCFRERPIPVYP